MISISLLRFRRSFPDWFTFGMNFMATTWRKHTVQTKWPTVKQRSNFNPSSCTHLTRVFLRRFENSTKRAFPHQLLDAVRVHVDEFSVRANSNGVHGNPQRRFLCLLKLPVMGKVRRRRRVPDSLKEAAFDASLFGICRCRQLPLVPYVFGDSCHCRHTVSEQLKLFVIYTTRYILVHESWFDSLLAWVNSDKPL